MRPSFGALSILVVGAGACSPESMSHARTGDFLLAFSPTRVVTLEEVPGSPIGVVADLVQVDNRLIVADQLLDRVLAFSMEGEFIDSIGGAGDGPGEFRRPHSLARYEGDILVADGTQRVTRITEDLDLVEIYRVDVPYRVRGITRIGGRVALTRVNMRGDADNFVFWSPGPGLGPSFDAPNPLAAEVPYWSMAFTTLVAATSDRVFVADNMVYPFRMYSHDLELVDSVGVAPLSWVAPRRPEAGEFAAVAGPGSEIRGFLRSFTKVHRLAVLDDRYLLVSHRYPIGEYAEDDEFRLDVYDTTEGVAKMWEDLLLPGRLLATDADCAWFLISTAPDPTRVGCYHFIGR